MAKIDLNASRAARQEVLREPMVVELENATYELPPELPIGVTDILADLANIKEDQVGPAQLNTVYEAMKLLFGEEQWADFRNRASMNDVLILIQGVFEAYGVSLGELAVSPS